MKIRIEKDLLERARICAQEVDATLSDWAGRALRMFRAGKLGRVAKTKTRKGATRASVVATLPGEPKDADDMRAALLAAVLYCEARRPAPFTTHLREGQDYLVEEQE